MLNMLKRVILRVGVNPISGALKAANSVRHSAFRANQRNRALARLSLAALGVVVGFPRSALAGPDPAFGAVVTIENPKDLPVDVGHVNLLYTMTCQEIAEAYHVRNYKDLQVPVILVLGEDDEHYVIDHSSGAGTIYLKQWVERYFVAAAVMIAFHRVLSNERFKSEVTKILMRFERVKPQSVTALRRSH
jgi:hypothetical protein